MADDLIGKTLGHGHRIERLLRSDAWGELYETARTDGTPGTYAAFVVSAKHAQDPERNKRFQSSGPTLKGLHDPAIARIHEVGITPEGRPYVISDLPKGTLLSDLLERRGTMQLGPAVQMVRHVGQALAAAHLKHLVHHDIRPQNIYLAGDPKAQTCRVLGFGLSEFKDAAVVAPTDTAMSVATASYVAPEQARGDVADHRADIYSTGALLFAALTGKPPVDPLSDAELPPPRRLNPAIPEAVEAVILRAMSADPADRYKFMNQFDVELMPHDDQESDLLDEMLNEFDAAFDLESSAEDRHTPPRPIMVKVPDPMEGRQGPSAAKGGQAELPPSPDIPKAPGVPQAQAAAPQGAPHPGAAAPGPLVQAPGEPIIGAASHQDDSPTLRPPKPAAAADDSPTPPRGLPAPDVPDFFEDEEEATPPKGVAAERVAGPKIGAVKPPPAQVPKVAKMPTPPSVRAVGQAPVPAGAAAVGPVGGDGGPAGDEESVPAPPRWLKPAKPAADEAEPAGPASEPGPAEEPDGVPQREEFDDDDAATVLFDAKRVSAMTEAREEAVAALRAKANAEAEAEAGEAAPAAEPSPSEPEAPPSEPEAPPSEPEAPPPEEEKAAIEEEEPPSRGLRRKPVPVAAKEPAPAAEPAAEEEAEEKEEEAPPEVAAAAPPESVEPSRPIPKKSFTATYVAAGAVVVAVAAVGAWQAGLFGGGESEVAPAPTPTAEPPKPAPTTAATAAADPAARAKALRDELVQAVTNNQPDDAIKALEQIAELDWKALDDDDARDALLKLLLTQAGRPDAMQTEKVYELVATKLGTIGPDVMFDLYTTRGGSQAAKHAGELLAETKVQMLGTPALRIAYEIRAAQNCDGVLMLLKRAKSDADIRGKKELERVQSCPAGVPCCLRNNAQLPVVLLAINRRLSGAGGESAGAAEPADAGPAPTAAPWQPPKGAGTVPTAPWTPPTSAPAAPTAAPTEPTAAPKDAYEGEDF